MLWADAPSAHCVTFQIQDKQPMFCCAFRWLPRMCLGCRFYTLLQEEMVSFRIFYPCLHRCGALRKGQTSNSANITSETVDPPKFHLVWCVSLIITCSQTCNTIRWPTQTGKSSNNLSWKNAHAAGQQRLTLLFCPHTDSGAAATQPSCTDETPTSSGIIPGRSVLFPPGPQEDTKLQIRLRTWASHLQLRSMAVLTFRSHEASTHVCFSSHAPPQLPDTLSVLIDHV